MDDHLTDPLPADAAADSLEAAATFEIKGHAHAAAKVKAFPNEPGVYLMKDAAGVVIYIGKAKNLRSRTGSYFLKAAQIDARTADWIADVADIDFVQCESEVDALLMESRLVKDIQPRNNKDLKDDKSFPYLMITTREEFPRVEITREPKTSGVKLYGPFTSAGRSGARSKSCSEFLSSAPAHSTSANRMKNGNGFVLVCSPASTNVPHRAICGSAKKTIGAISDACKLSSTVARQN